MKEIVKIKTKKENMSYSEREKFINTEIQKTIDLYNQRGFIVIEHNVLNKASMHTSVEFTIKQMVK
jgi:hypothetical protein